MPSWWEDASANAGSLADLVKTVEESRIPVIAAISGVAYGGGVSHARGVDWSWIVLVSFSARVSEDFLLLSL
jgi:enoyl-CoA hydratase/carnithine racemase